MSSARSSSGVSPEALSEFERRTHERFLRAVESAIAATWEETRRLELEQVTLDVKVGIMRRALDGVRVRFGWV